MAPVERKTSVNDKCVSEAPPSHEQQVDSGEDSDKLTAWENRARMEHWEQRMQTLGKTFAS